MFFFVCFSSGRIRRQRALEELDNGNLFALIIVFVFVVFLVLRGSQFNFKSAPRESLNVMFICEPFRCVGFVEDAREVKLLSGARWRAQSVGEMAKSKQTQPNHAYQVEKLKFPFKSVNNSDESRVSSLYAWTDQLETYLREQMQTAGESLSRHSVVSIGGWEFWVKKLSPELWAVISKRLEFNLFLWILYISVIQKLLKS